MRQRGTSTNETCPKGIAYGWRCRNWAAWSY